MSARQSPILERNALELPGTGGATMEITVYDTGPQWALVAHGVDGARTVLAHGFVVEGTAEALRCWADGMAAMLEAWRAQEGGP